MDNMDKPKTNPTSKRTKLKQDPIQISTNNCRHGCSCEAHKNHHPPLLTG